MNRFGHDLVGHAGKLQVELEAGDAVLGAAEFEVHVAEVIFGTDDVGEQVVALHVALLVVLGDETDGNAGDRCLDRNAGIHQREHAGADARHRGGAVGFHHFADHADGVGEIFRARDDRLDRTLGQGAMTDLAAARATESAGFTDAERREVVMEDEALGIFAASVGVDHSVPLRSARASRGPEPGFRRGRKSRNRERAGARRLRR